MLLESSVTLEGKARVLVCQIRRAGVRLVSSRTEVCSLSHAAPGSQGFCAVSHGALHESILNPSTDHDPGRQQVVRAFPGIREQGLYSELSSASLNYTFFPKPLSTPIFTRPPRSRSPPYLHPLPFFVLLFVSEAKIYQVCLII